MSSTALTNLTKIEASLWEAADQLRANSKLTSSEYCMPVLGVIFLRQATNRYDTALAAIQADQAAGRMPKRPLKQADFKRRRALMLPPQAHYMHLMTVASSQNIGKALVGAMNAIEANLQAVASQGVPNYFGAQRFGFDGGNVEQGRAMLAREIRVRNPKKKGIYLSAVRSFVFNEVLALRIQQGHWGATLPGDVMDEAGRPTGPLWGRGRVITTDQAQALENAVAQRHATLCEGMEYAGLGQERRALVASPGQMSWEWPQANQLVLTFSLPAGTYATSVLNELLHTTEPDRYSENESAVAEPQ
jgi:hypothetical protein